MHLEDHELIDPCRALKLTADRIVSAMIPATLNELLLRMRFVGPNSLAFDFLSYIATFQN